MRKFMIFFLIYKSEKITIVQMTKFDLKKLFPI